MGNAKDFFALIYPALIAYGCLSASRHGVGKVRSGVTCADFVIFVISNSGSTAFTQSLSARVVDIKKVSQIRKKFSDFYFGTIISGISLKDI